MPHDDPALAAMIGSRICHDLASPLGAIANGLELLALSGTAQSAELALVDDSVRGAKATLDLARLAYGRATPDEAVSAEGLHAVMAGYYAGKSRMTLDWQLSGGHQRPRAQIVVLACLAAEQALPRGGVMAMEGDAGAVRITARIKPGAAPPAPDLTLWDGVAGKIPLPAPDPRQADFHMLRLCLAAQGMSLTTRMDADAFVITL